MKIPFIKMQAQGNDFVVFYNNSFEGFQIDFSKLAVDVCNRHFGIGADGLVILKESASDSHKMIIYNADGSRAEMCGSALRCCAALIYSRNKALVISIITDNGILQCRIAESDPSIVKVEIGIPEMIENNLAINDHIGDFVKVGNPHFVVLDQELDHDTFVKTSKEISESNFFSDGINIEFIRIVNRDEIDMLVWERGVGATLACGTGAAASVFSCSLKGLLDEVVKVNSPGGFVVIRNITGRYFLEGSVNVIAEGNFVWKA